MIGKKLFSHVRAMLNTERKYILWVFIWFEVPSNIIWDVIYTMLSQDCNKIFVPIIYYLRNIFKYIPVDYSWLWVIVQQ